MSAAAPIFSNVAASSGAAEQAAWTRFAAAQNPSEFHAAWLAILCAQVGRIGGAMLLLAEHDSGEFKLAAAWPEHGRDLRHLAPLAERTLKERRGVVAAGESASEATQVGYPVELEGQLRGAVVLELPSSSGTELQRALRLLHWASAWLLDRLRQQLLAESERRAERLALVGDVAALVLQEPRTTAAALAVVDLLASRLGCDQVSLGLEIDGTVQVEAISHSSHFDRKANRVRAIAEAMNEVLDLGTAIVLPALNDDSAGEIAHAALMQDQQRGSVCSVPLGDGGRTIGVLTFERSPAQPPFDETQLAVCTACGLMLGPIFRLALQNERGPLRRSHDALRAGVQALLGPGHPGLKLIALLVIAFVGISTLVQVPYRVPARAVLEGAVQRVLAAPFDGYIAASMARAGDVVKSGQPVARLLDRDLKLEQARWTSEHELAQRRLRQAAAAQDRAGMAMASAQVDQAQSQLTLVEDKLARATVHAPFDGVIVQGDLSQSLGSPVEQGKVLFEVAPLGEYRVILNVDERDIDQVAAGQTGELVLAGLPRERLAFKVVTVTPISVAQDGRNVFRVEARLDQASPRLRPGMEGVGKVMVTERSLIWIWTHGFTDWLRLSLWRWLP